MLGKWITRAAWGAEVFGPQASGILLGYVIYKGINIPTYWDVDGRSTNQDFTLSKRISGSDAALQWGALKLRTLARNIENR